LLDLTFLIYQLTSEVNNDEMDICKKVLLGRVGETT